MKRIDIDRKLFPLAFSVMRRNWLPCGAAAVLLLVANIGDGYLRAPLAFATLHALIIMIVGFSACRLLLTGALSVAGARSALPRAGSPGAMPG